MTLLVPFTPSSPRTAMRPKPETRRRRGGPLRSPCCPRRRDRPACTCFRRRSRCRWPGSLSRSPTSLRPCALLITSCRAVDAHRAEVRASPPSTTRLPTSSKSPQTQRPLPNTAGAGDALHCAGVSPKGLLAVTSPGPPAASPFSSPAALLHPTIAERPRSKGSKKRAEGMRPFQQHRSQPFRTEKRRKRGCFKGGCAAEMGRWRSG